MSWNNDGQFGVDCKERVRVNQQRLRSNLKSQYDFIVCGSGSSGSVAARRLAETSDVSVLLLEAGGDDDVPSVTESLRWFENFGTERLWDFEAQANPHLNGRAIPLPMGKVPGGASSVNIITWARGHKNDWDFFAEEAGDPGWNYESVLNMFRRIEDWHGSPDPKYRGTGGPVFVQPAPDTCCPRPSRCGAEFSGPFWYRLRVGVSATSECLVEECWQTRQGEQRRLKRRSMSSTNENRNFCL